MSEGAWLTYWVTCDYCGAMEQDPRLTVMAGSELPRPRMPPWWSKVNGKDVCNLHDVHVDLILVGGGGDASGPKEEGSKEEG